MRAQRLQLGSGCNVYACDQKDSIKLKLRCRELRKAPLRCASLHHVPCDLTAADWYERLLAAPGYDENLPTAFAAEGLLYYLEPADVAALVRVLTERPAPGSRLLASIISQGALDNARKSSAQIFKSFRWGVDRPRGFFRSLGCGRARVFELGRSPCNDWWVRHPPQDVRVPSRFKPRARRTWFVDVPLGGGK